MSPIDPNDKAAYQASIGAYGRKNLLRLLHTCGLKQGTNKMTDAQLAETLRQLAISRIDKRKKMQSVEQLSEIEDHGDATVDTCIATDNLENLAQRLQEPPK